MKKVFLNMSAVAIGLLAAAAGNAQTVGYSGEVVVAYGNEKGSARFMKPENQMGCGTVVSVRNVNQVPEYDREYEAQFGNNTNTGDIAALAAQNGVVGLVAGAVASTLVDATVAANKETQSTIKLLNVQKDQGLVKAVQLRLDDGSEINLPLLDAPRLSPFGHYKVGNRYRVYYSATFNNVQLVVSGERASYDSPERAEVARKLWCKRTLAEDKIKAVLEAHAHKVDETKIY